MAGLGLKEEFEMAADWRQTVAAEHPEDSRNLEAVAVLNQLAGTVAAINPQVLAAYEELFSRTDEDSGFRAIEEQEEMKLRVGFHYFPATAEEFCRDLISSQTGGNRSLAAQSR